MKKLFLTGLAICLFASCYLTKEDKLRLEHCLDDAVCVEETMVVIEDEHEYRRAEKYYDAMENYLRLEQSCRTAGKGVMITCDPASKWCGRWGRNRELSIHELRTATCAY